MAAQLQAGDLLDGRYRIGASIAHGGMSTVYHCIDTRLDRDLAAKVMDPALAADPAARTRFEREARAVARLDHPCLVNVFDQGTDERADGDLVFLIMELVPGGTLRELLRERGPMPPHAALAVTEPVLQAQGRFDDTCPPAWARATQQALTGAGVDSTLEWYDDGHAFGPAFVAAMERTVRFLRARMPA